jgi:hypothetical protein
MPSGTFTITVTGLAALTTAFQNYPAISLPYLQQALAKSWLVLAQNTTTATVPFRTGFLLQSFGGTVDGLTATWGPDVRYKTSYSRFVQFGTGPHIIEPKDAKALYWPGAQHPVKIVHHPGTKANDYMGRIVRASEDDINEQFASALEQIASAIAKQSSV